MKHKHKDQQNKPQKLKNNAASYARYSGLAFEMFFIIGAGVFGGIELDKVLNTSPLLTALLSLIGVVLAIYFAVKEVLKKS